MIDTETDIRDLAAKFWQDVAAAQEETKQGATGGQGTTTWPQHSDALGVHPSQAEEARESAKRRGVPTDFDKAGRPVFTSAAHKRAYAKAYGFFSRTEFSH